MDAIADSSALTVKVLHRAQPSLLSQERRPLVAVLVWLMFAVGMVINLLWAYLHRERPNSHRQHLWPTYPLGRPLSTQENSTFPFQLACANLSDPQLPLLR